MQVEELKTALIEKEHAVTSMLSQGQSLKESERQVWTRMDDFSHKLSEKEVTIRMKEEKIFDLEWKVQIAEQDLKNEKGIQNSLVAEIKDLKE